MKNSNQMKNEIIETIALIDIRREKLENQIINAKPEQVDILWSQLKKALRYRGQLVIEMENL